MNLQASLIGTTFMVVAGLGLIHAIAAEPTPAKPTQQFAEQVSQQVDVCRQTNAAYRKLYTIEESDYAITICQSGNQYYHIKSEKSNRLVVRYAANSTQHN